MDIEYAVDTQVITTMITQPITEPAITAPILDMTLEEAVKAKRAARRKELKAIRYFKVSLKAALLDYNNELLPIPEYTYGIPLPTVPFLHNVGPQTQKARGLYALIKDNTFYDQGVISAQAEHLLLISKTFPIWMCNSDITLISWLGRYTAYRGKMPYNPSGLWMARPCPSKPRHGFVESRVITTPHDLLVVIRETRQADPRGEVIITPFIEAQVSGVVTNSNVSVGGSHNGATSGNGSVSIPCLSHIEQYLGRSGPLECYTKQSCYTKSVSRTRYIGLSKTRVPYVEMVNGKLVQVRYGPQTSPGLTRWSPHYEILVTHTWEPSQAVMNDFLVFEEQLKEKYEKYSNCILILRHGTLACHAAVQAIAIGMSVIAEKEVSIAIHEIVIFPKTSTTATNPEEMRREITHGLTIARTTIPDSSDLHETGQHVMWAVAVIQGMASLELTPNVLKHIAAAGHIITAYGLAACVGEHRHFYAKGPGKQGKTLLGPSGSHLQFVDYDVHDASEFSRSERFVQALHLPLDIQRGAHFHVIGLIQVITHDFGVAGWSNGYGGLKWAECSAALGELACAYFALQSHMRRSVAFTLPASTDINALETLCKRIIGTANKFITLSHNGGKCLTKFVTSTDLLQAGIVPGFYLVHPLTRSLHHDTSSFSVSGTETPAKLESDTTGILEQCESANDTSDTLSDTISVQ